MTDQAAIDVARQNALRDALQLVQDRRLEIFTDSRGSEVAAVHLLDKHHLLGSDELVDAACARDRVLHQSLNLVPVGEVRRREQTDHQYINWLESALTAVLGEIEAASTLAGVQRTVKGQQLVKRAGIARAKWDAVRHGWLTAKDSRRTPTPAP